MSDEISLIQEKQAKLAELRIYLNEEFIGLESVIDQLIESIKVWYIYPEIQIRPTIVCLWGLTGVGKTDLVRKMISFLKIQDRFLEIEMDNNSDEKSTIQEKLSESTIDYDGQCVILLDEFQNFRTIDKGGATVTNKSFSDIWTLLSDGTFHSNANKRSKILENLLDDKYWADFNHAYGTAFSSNIRHAENMSLMNPKVYQQSIGTAKSVKRLLRLSESLEEIMKFSEEKILQLYTNSLNDPKMYEGTTYKKLLIIISGNLDEAYTMAKTVNDVDLDADYYHEYSKNITILDIKRALTKRFQPEQIARMGNTQILYPSLSKKNYYRIIEKKCNEIVKLVKDTKSITINLDESVYETMYKNGVFPTQGVRPLLSTITNILSSAIPSFIYEGLLNNVDSIEIRCENQQLIGIVAGNHIVVEIPTTIETLRKNIDEDTSTIVAVHELGHAIAYSILFGVVPAQICIDSVSSYSNGFVLQHQMIDNRENLINNLIISMAGRCAEELVFGENSTSVGASGDITQATNIAWNWIGRYGFNGSLSHITSSSINNDGMVYDKTNVGIATENMLKDAKEQSSDLLHKNQKFYKTLPDYLLTYESIPTSVYIRISKDFGYNFKEVPIGEKIMIGYKEITKKFLQS